MTPEERARELATWRKRLHMASLPPMDYDMAGYPMFRWSGPVAIASSSPVAIPTPSVQMLPSGALASWRRGTWA